MQSIGERLEEARKRKGISIREAAEATKIRGDYLHKFESNQFDIKLPEIYVRGFLRTYANYLKLPPDKVMSDYNALGLGEVKAPRSLSREVYGRMDLSVSTAKPEKENEAPVAAAEAPAPAEPAAPRNPATFVPRAAGGMQIDRALLIKAIAVVGGAAIVLLLVIYLFMGRGEKHPTTSVPPSPDIAWVHPQAGEAFITLVANDRVQVTVTQSATGTILYQGTLPRGDRRDVPRRGQLRINSDAPENLRVVIDNREWELKDAKGNYLRSADINPR